MSLRDQYPKAISRDAFQEGGYTFLKRALSMNLQSGEPTVINTGDMYLSYDHQESHKNFMDGVTILRGDRDSDAFQRFSEVGEAYDVSLGVSELKSEGRIKGADSSVSRGGWFKRLGFGS